MTRSAFPFAPTTPIDSLDEVLLTSETWSDYQALQLIETQLNASLAGLTRDERERYRHMSETVTGSLSWRITAPLRAAMHGARRASARARAGGS